MWVWPGPGAPPELPSYAAPPSGFTVHAEIEVEVPVEHGLLMEASIAHCCHVPSSRPLPSLALIVPINALLLGVSHASQAQCHSPQNLLDLAHAPFTHTSTFAKGWPIPEVVRFRAEQVPPALNTHPSEHCAAVSDQAVSLR